MANPIRNRNSVGLPPVHFYQEWINGDHYKWPHDPTLTPAESSNFRETLKSVIYREGAVKAADNFFTRIRGCTAPQLATLAKSLHRGNYHLDNNSLEEAVIGMGMDGNLAKIQALYRNLTWLDFKEGLGLHQALAGQHTMRYASDVVAWYNREHHGNADEPDQTLMLMSLQQSNADASKLAGIMQGIRGDGLETLHINTAIEHTISFIYDLTPETAKSKAQAFADQFLLLHKGWGIEYPVALVTLLAKEDHGKTFDIPEVGALGYSAARIDVQVARVFNHTYVPREKGEHSAVVMARMMQSLYDKKSHVQFCIDGAAVFLPQAPTPDFDVEGSVFQDVGQP